MALFSNLFDYVSENLCVFGIRFQKFQLFLCVRIEQLLVLGSAF